MVDVLIGMSPDVDALHDDKSAMTALMAAASNGSMPIIDKLIAAGADVDAADDDGATPLRLAAFNGHVEVVAQLLEAGADVIKVEPPEGDSLRWRNSHRDHESKNSMLRPLDHPVTGSQVIAHTPLEFSDSTLDDPVHSPVLGQDTDAVLTELGFDDEAIAAMRKSGVIR